MFPMRIVFLLLCLLLTGPAIPSFAEESDVLKFPFVETVLKNGLKVILLEEHKAPVVTVQVWYHVGERNEVTGKTGLSHLMEHMMFKGTPKYGKGEFSRIIQKNGGNDNAFTTQDYTAFFQNLSSDRISVSLDLESDRMGHLLIDPKEFQLERDVVKEERRMRTDDNPSDSLFEQLSAQAYTAHPYHSPVIGWMTDLNHLTRDDLYRHYQKYYLPNNATLIIVGDFKSAELLPVIRQYYESVPAGPNPPPVQVEEPEQKGERRFILRKEAQIPIVLIGYKVPNYSDPDHFALEVLSAILSSGKSSRLYQKLVYDKKLALDVGSDYSELSSDPPLFTLYGKPQQGKRIDELESAILEEIEALQRTPVTEKELQKVKTQLETQFILNRDSNFFVAMQIGMAESTGAGSHYFDTWLDSIRKVTAQEVMKVANQYLTTDHKTTGTLIPLTHDKPKTAS